MAIGGSSVAFSSPYFINPANPASYMAFDSNSFVFDAGLYTRSGTLKTKTESQKTKYGAMSNLCFGFPVTSWWRSSLGILPYSNVGYEVRNEHVVENVGNVVQVYKGSGGLNKAYIGNAFQPFKNFSVGVNASYIFGNIDKEKAATFPDSANFADAMIKSSARLNELYFDLGFLYRKDLGSGKFLQAGLTLSPSQSLKGNEDRIAYTFTRNYISNRDVLKDTVSYEPGVEGKVELPTAIGAGVMVGNSNRWMFAADFNWQNWSNFSYLGTKANLKDNFRVSLGGQFRPSPTDMGLYWQRINFRMGFRYEQSYLELQNTRLNDIGISFGVGLPMKKSRSTINLAVEAGTQGTTNNGLIKENYIRFTLGTALQERWFIKRRYN